jgi:hypothetical protein
MTAAVARPRDVAIHAPPAEPSASGQATLRGLILYFPGLGTWGFGGPAVGVFLPAYLMVVAVLGAVLWMRKVPEPVRLLAAGLVGILLHEST